jgi:hypothetical protein
MRAASIAPPAAECNHVGFVSFSTTAFFYEPFGVNGQLAIEESHVIIRVMLDPHIVAG